MKASLVALAGGVLGLAVAAPGLAQTDAGTPIELGRTFRIPSKVLGETRVVDVSLPDDYVASGDRRYPVLVVLDGEFEHEAAVAVTRFYAFTSQLPPMIVVGVRNTDRMRDMTPAPVPGFRPPPEARTAGGADRFLTFLADELIPHLDGAYRTAPLRVISGHSLSGLFALYALAKRPELFTGYLVMEPSVWWNGGREVEDARATLGQPAARRARVMLVNTPFAGVDTTQWGGTKPMVRRFETTGETHASMALSGMMQGLRGMFADFEPAEWRPGTRPIAMLARYDSLAARVGYAVPIPAQAFAQVFRMSLDSRFFDDAQAVLDRMEKALGASDDTREMRAKLAKERAMPQPASFVPLVIPARRPSPREAAAFLGRWTAIDAPQAHEVEIRASSDTIVVRDRMQAPDGEWDEGDHPVIQVTADGALEWGLPFFRGIAALLVLRGRVLEDGTMVVTREARGWVPRGPGPDLTRTERFRRVAPPAP
ncbi:MAG: alpha/beta hydrolase-fold protein [bacterium]